MAFQSKHRYARISPTKVRPLANMVRGKFVDEALDILRYQPHRGARMLEKVIRTALANAQDPEQNPGRIVDERDLFISEACIDGGPMLEANVAHSSHAGPGLVPANTWTAVKQIKTRQQPKQTTTALASLLWDKK